MKTACPNNASAVIDEASSSIDELSRQLTEQKKKIDKLLKFISNLEADGDRLNKELVIANSFRNCFDNLNIPTPMFMVNSSLEFQYANQAFFDMTGTTRAILESKANCDEIMQCGHFRGGCLLKECFALKEAKKGITFPFESKDGRIYKLTVDAIPIINLANNEVLGGFEVFRTVTEDTKIQYLVFELSGQEYGLNIKKLSSILSAMRITTMPNMPAYVRGVINLRGQIIPIIDLKEQLGLPPAPATGKETILIIESSTGECKHSRGFIADKVNGVATFDLNDIESSKDVGITTGMDYLAGIAKTDQRTLVLLDLDRLCSWAEDA